VHHVLDAKTSQFLCPQIIITVFSSRPLADANECSLQAALFKFATTTTTTMMFTKRKQKFKCPKFCSASKKKRTAGLMASQGRQMKALVITRPTVSVLFIYIFRCERDRDHKQPRLLLSSSSFILSAAAAALMPDTRMKCMIINFSGIANVFLCAFKNAAYEEQLLPRGSRINNSQ
jgi:hypothetical protein